MNTRISDEPPSISVIKRIISKGAAAKEQSKHAKLLERLRQSCYLNSANRRLDGRQRLLAQYKKDGLVLFVGSGVSRCSGIPDWKTLAKEIMIELLPSVTYEEVQRAFPALITQFQLATSTLGPRRFRSRLYEKLYGRVPCKKLLENIPPERYKQCGWSGWGEIRVQLEKNETLKHVGNLLMLSDGTSEFRRNPQIHAILTTNVDNLLELYCKAVTVGRRLLTVVDRPSVGDHPDAIPLYHLHGMLNARHGNFMDQSLADDLLPDLVFSESTYYDTLGSPTRFVNHAPQSYFQRLNVLFIGTSLEDPNLRRWLYSSFRERVEQRTKYLRELYKKTFD